MIDLTNQEGGLEAKTDVSINTEIKPGVRELVHEKYPVKFDHDETYEKVNSIVKNILDIEHSCSEEIARLVFFHKSDFIEIVEIFSLKSPSMNDDLFKYTPFIKSVKDHLMNFPRKKDTPESNLLDKVAELDTILFQMLKQ